MTYTKQTWVDGSTGGTPLSAARLNHMEDGIEAAAAGLATVTVADLPSGSVIHVAESGGAYTRGTARTDICVIFTGTADPASVALNGDKWDKL